MAKKLEVNMEVLGRQTMCPSGGKSYAVSIEGTCRACPYMTEITERKRGEMSTPAKVHCAPPIKHQNVIFDYRIIEWDTLREKKEEV